MEQEVFGYVTIAQARELTELSETTIRRAIATGELPAYRRGRSVRIKRADLDLLFRRVPSASDR